MKLGHIGLAVEMAEKLKSIAIAMKDVETMRNKQNMSLTTFSNIKSCYNHHNLSPEARNLIIDTLLKYYSDQKLEIEQLIKEL